MAERDGDNAYWSNVQNEEVPHCGLCDPVTRHMTDGEVVIRCPQCWPPHSEKANAPRRDELLPQHWRCGICRAVVYRVDRDLPCAQHRTVARFQREYHEGLSGEVPLLPSPVTEAGARSARSLMAERPRPGPPEPPPAAEPEPPPPSAEEDADETFPF